MAIFNGQVIPDGEQKFYDCHGQLAGWTSPSGTYDAHGNRVGSVLDLAQSMNDTVGNQSVDEWEGRGALELWACGYRARCASPGCNNLARVILRRVASGGAPDRQEEVCLRHARAAIVKDKAAAPSFMM